MDNSSGKVSIVMLTMNRPQFIFKAIESVLEQSYINWELLIIHDGANKSMVPTISAFLQKDSRISYFHRENSKNIADAMNYGISKSQGEFIAVLDDDDQWINSDKLLLQVEYLKNNSDVIVVGGGAIVVDENGIEKIRYKKSGDFNICRANALLANPIIHSTVLFKKDYISKLGLYDTSLLGYQDWDLWLKVMQDGKVYNFNEYFINYRVWKGGGTTKQVRNNLISALKIIKRNKDRYPKYYLARIINIFSFFLLSMPISLRRKSIMLFSVIKKNVFSYK